MLGLVFVIVAAIGVVAHFVGPGGSERELGFGVIHVDQPEIYTRERLVNDRFEQDDWLRARLAKTDQLSFDAQARSKGASSRSTNTETRAGSEAQSSAAAAPAPQAPAALEPVHSDPIDDFHDRLAYREEVRSEIIENQLDDSHDIAGNTLYHLKFDTAIIPLGGSVSGFAVVDAAMKGPTPRYFTCDGLGLDQRQFDECVGAFLGDLRTLALKIAAERVAGERGDEMTRDVDEVRKLRDPPRRPTSPEIGT